jgi:hypothetical protein
VSAGFGFKADKLERISLNSWEPAEVTPALSGDWDYYERLISLIDTDNAGAFLTNGILPVEKMRTDGEIAGLRLGSSMSEAVRVWGKPHTLFRHKGGGAVLAYGFGSLEFNGEKLSIIRLCLLNSPEVRFDHGLTGQSTQGEFAEALGFGILANDTLELSRKSGTVQLTLTWANYTSGKKLVWIRLDRPRLPGKQP